MYIIKYKHVMTGRNTESGLFKTDIQAYRWLADHPEAKSPELKKVTDHELDRWRNYNKLFPNITR